MENEEVIVEQAKTDPEAFGRLYDMHYQPIFAFLLNRTGNAEVAKDLTSETFFQALKNIHKYKQRGKPFKSWLFAIAVAQIGNFYRGRRKYLQVTTEECPELVASETFLADASIVEDQDRVELEYRLNILDKLLGQLNEKQQNILSLRYFSKKTIPEISQIMKMKEGTIKSHIHRATKKLQVLMSEELDSNNYDRKTTAQSRRALGSSGI